MSQYLYDSWGTEKGFPGGSISGIAQTPDGFLWIGTDRGLLRFDGWSFRQFQQASPSSFPIGPVQTLMVDGQGNLWILLRSTQVLRYQDGAFELSRGEAENGITAIGHGTENAILLSSLAMGTLTYKNNRFLTVSPAALFVDSESPAHTETPDQRSARYSWSYGNMPDRLAAPTSAVTSIASTDDAKVWLGTEGAGLFYLKKGGISSAANLAGVRISCLLPIANSELWIGTNRGLLRWNGSELTRGGVPSDLQHVQVLSLIRDRDANVWVGTNHGLVRLNSTGVFSLASALPATAGPVTALFEDREGNLWFGGMRGLERLRDSAFVTYSIAGLHSQSTGPVYVDSDGFTWIAPMEGGLRWLKGEKGGSVAAAELSHDIVYSIAGGGKNDLWIGRQRGGLTRLHHVSGSFTVKTYTPADGLAQNTVFAVYESHDGKIWSGTLNNGVSELHDGHFTTYTTGNGLASNTVSSIAEGIDGTMWFGTPNGLSSLSKGSWRTYTVHDGLISSDVNCLLVDSKGVLWIGTTDGLAFRNAGHIQIPRVIPDSLHGPVLGVAEDKNGELWVATTSHVFRVNRSSLMDDMLTESNFREYGLADGLQGTEGVKRDRSVVSDAKGQIWFSTNHGLSLVNPSRGMVNSPPALVHIEAVSADGMPLDFRRPIRIPPAKEKTTFRFVGLSLRNSERVRYRYRLDGFDHSWSEAGTNREATYGNLRPGPYRFRVLASNSDGMWNSAEVSVGFEVEPAFWQTWWFRLGSVACLGLAILLVYRLRTHQLTQLLSVRFEERLAERARVAQELHDTLLQGVVSASMQLHVAVEGLSEESPMRPTLSHILQVMGQVIEEGRNTLRGLRSSIERANDLQDSFSRIPLELGTPAADFRVVVEGDSMPLRAAVRDDVYRIGREAVVNAFRHSGARNVDLHLEYGADQLRIFVRDDGCGIDPQILKYGRDGHWGMSGMRERAERIGGKLRVFSRSGNGTEVELRVPSDIAFESHRARSASRWFTSASKRYSRNSGVHE